MGEAEVRAGDSRPRAPAANPRRSGRRPGRSDSREAILRAARRMFSEHGYERTTVRGIAREAAVDAALVHHFFRSKDGVFAAAIHEAVRPMELMPTLLGGDPATLGERLLTSVLSVWESAERHEPLLAVIRSAVSHERAAAILRDFLGTEVLGPLAEALGEPRPALRSALLGSQLIGLVMARYIIRVEPLASASTRTLVAAYAPVIQSCLAAEGAAAGHEETGREEAPRPAAATGPALVPDRPTAPEHAPVPVRATATGRKLHGRHRDPGVDGL